jgi:uncharacterized membrane-anchored protein YitT (DUF2179 family)
MLERDWKTLLVAAVTAVALACYPMVSQGPIHTFVAWGAGASAYLNSTFNLPSWHHKIGLDSLLYAAGIPVSTGVWFALNILLTALLWRCREYIDQHDTLALLVAIMLVFSYSLHDYDLVSVPPLLAALWWYVRRSRVLICGALALVAMLFAPGRLLQAHTRVMAAVPALAQWRILVVAIMAAALVAFSVAKTSRRRASAAVVTSG